MVFALGDYDTTWVALFALAELFATEVHCPGEPRKVALITVANKPPQQIFAILKSRVPYDPYYLREEKGILPFRGLDF